MNPSLIGRDGSGKLRFSSIHRNLYRPIRGPLHSTGLAIDYSFCNSIFDVGINASNETQGDGFLRTNSLAGLIGLRIKTANNWVMNGGIQFGIIQQNLDWGEYLFSDELNPIWGAIYPSSNDNARIVAKISPDIGAGVDFTNFNYGKHGSRNAVNTGFAIMHATNNTNIGLLNDFTLPMKYTLHWSWIHRRNPNNIANSFQVMARLDKQSQFSNLLLRFNYSLIEEISLGLGVRGAYSIVGNINSPTFSCNIYPSDNISVHLNFETSIGGANVIGAGNTFEIGLILRPSNSFCFSNGNVNPTGKGSVKRARTTCPVFYKTKVTPNF